MNFLEITFESAFIPVIAVLLIIPVIFQVKAFLNDLIWVETKNAQYFG